MSTENKEAQNEQASTTPDAPEATKVDIKEVKGKESVSPKATKPKGKSEEMAAGIKRETY